MPHSVHRRPRRVHKQWKRFPLQAIFVELLLANVIVSHLKLAAHIFERNRSINFFARRNDTTQSWQNICSLFPNTVSINPTADEHFLTNSIWQVCALLWQPQKKCIHLSISPFLRRSDRIRLWWWMGIEIGMQSAMIGWIMVSFGVRWRTAYARKWKCVVQWINSDNDDNEFSVTLI